MKQDQSKNSYVYRLEYDQSKNSQVYRMEQDQSKNSQVYRMEQDQSKTLYRIQKYDQSIGWNRTSVQIGIELQTTIAQYTDWNRIRVNKVQYKEKKQDQSKQQLGKQNGTGLQ